MSKVWHADIRLVGTTFSRSHMTCFQSVANAKPNGQPAYSPHSTCCWFGSKIFWEWIHQSVRVSVCGVACVWTCECVPVIMSMYVPSQLPVPTSTYPASCSCSTHIPSGPSQTTAYPPILPQPLSRTSRQQTGTLHLLEKPESRYHSTPCSQYITVHHNVPQCAGGVIWQHWPFGGRFYYKK